MAYTRRDFIKASGFAAAAIVPGLPRITAGANRARRRPNILFIMSDDHSVNTIGCYKRRLSRYARTPHIDRIAKEGMRLENCFCTNSICVPSRASILTGQYSHVNDVYGLADSLDPKKVHVGGLLQEAGYQTAVIGKWHLKTEPAGFDYYNVLPGQGKYHNPVLKEKGGGSKRYEGFSTDIITDLSLKWLKGRDPDKPFCLMTHYKNCHAPWDFAERHADLYKDVELPEPASLWEDKSHRSEGSREYGLTIETMAGRMEKKNYVTGTLDTSGMTARQRKKAAYQKLAKNYLRCVAGIDENVGRMLKYVDEQGLARETVVIYTSDQGYFLGEHNYIDKRWIFEESLRMPFVVRYPGEIAAGSASEDMVLNVDFAPLMLDYAGAERGEAMQGVSFRANLGGRTPADWRKAVYYRYWLHGARPAHLGIRTKRYKLVFFYGLGLGVKGAQKKSADVGWELYDLDKDPRELQNVYGQTAYSDIAGQLKKQLLKLKSQYRDTDENHPEFLKCMEKYWDKM